MWLRWRKERFENQMVHQLFWPRMELLERLKKQQYVSVIWTCLVRCHFWKNHPRYSRWVNDVKKTFFVCENGIQVSHRISSRMGEHRFRKPTATSRCLSQAYKQLMTRAELCVTGSRHKLWATTSWKCKQIYQNGFNHSRKDWRGDLQFWHVCPADVDIPPPALLSAPPPAKPTSNEAWGKHNSSTHFCKDPNCEVCRRPKVTRAPCKRNPDDWSDRIEIAARFGDTKNSRPQGSQWRARIEKASQPCSGCARLGDAMDSKLFMQVKISSGDAEKSSNILTQKRKSEIH